MKTYTIDDYVNGNYELQNHIISSTKLKMLVLDIFSLLISFCGFFLMEIEVKKLPFLLKNFFLRMKDIINKSVIIHI